MTLTAITAVEPYIESAPPVRRRYYICFTGSPDGAFPTASLIDVNGMLYRYDGDGVKVLQFDFTAERCSV